MQITKEITDFLASSNAIEWVYDEVSLHDAENAFSYITSFRGLDVYNILHCHEILMYKQPIENRYKGHFRDCPVYIWGKEAVHYSLITPYIDTVITKINQDDDWKETHVLFEKCHPFIDGNGRIGRILMNFHRLRIWLPILDVNTVGGIAEYYSWFN